QCGSGHDAATPVSGEVLLAMLGFPPEVGLLLPLASWPSFISKGQVRTVTLLLHMARECAIISVETFGAGCNSRPAVWRMYMDICAEPASRWRAFPVCHETDSV